MNVDSKIFLGKRFKDYYLRNIVPAPMSISQREFGFGTLDDKIKFRHKSFSSEKELQNYLRRDTPFYISYSAAYYEFPENRSMKDKGWSGADLIFDLDADMDFLDKKILDEVRKQTVNLMEFLVDDFNLSQEKISINFSGSKGYHIHCWDESVLKFGGEERREMVDYVTATGLDWKNFLEEKEVQSGIMFTGRRSLKERSTILVGPKEDSSGWAGRIYDGVLDDIEGSGISVDKKRKLRKLLERGIWEGVEGFRKKSFDRIIEKYSVKLTGDTDKMVTLDTSRLIRLPDSLHGGTGLKAVKVKDIGKFKPQVDAIAFGDGEVKLETVKDVNKFKLKDKAYGPYKQGERLAVPEYAAVYLILKDGAEFVK